MSGTLKKRWTLPDSVIHHIFQGDVSGNSFSGFHSEAEVALDPATQYAGQPNPAMLQRRLDGKTYKLNVKIKIGGRLVQTAKTSTFFPNPRLGGATRWTKANIVRWIEQALTDPRDSVRSSRAQWTSQLREIRTTDTKGVVTSIRVNGVSCHVLYQAGEIASVYPADLDDASALA